MEITKKKLVGAIMLIGAIASIVCLILILNPTILNGASIKIEGLEDFYGNEYNQDFTLDFLLTNDGTELITVKYSSVYQILGSGKEKIYPDVKSNPSSPKIPVGTSQNISLTIPAHEARGVTEFKISIMYNDYKTTTSEIFDVTWY